MSYKLPKVQCFGNVQPSILNRETNEFRDKLVVSQIKRLYPNLSKYSNEHLLIRWELWIMQQEETSGSLFRIVQEEFNDNEND